MTLQFTPRPSRHTPKFPNAIRRYRVQMGLSQHSLGVVLGLHRSMVSLWERGLRVPSVPRLFRMARELGTMPEALYHDFYSAFPQEGASTNTAAA
jgi:transcriptional regulator with XRE-family HTH domain